MTKRQEDTGTVTSLRSSTSLNSTVLVFGGGDEGVEPALTDGVTRPLLMEVDGRSSPIDVAEIFFLRVRSGERVNSLFLGFSSGVRAGLLGAWPLWGTERPGEEESAPDEGVLGSWFSEGSDTTRLGFGGGVSLSGDTFWLLFEESFLSFFMLDFLTKLAFSLVAFSEKDSELLLLLEDPL